MDNRFDKKNIHSIKADELDSVNGGVMSGNYSWKCLNCKITFSSESERDTHASQNPTHLIMKYSV